MQVRLQAPLARRSNARNARGMHRGRQTLETLECPCPRLGNGTWLGSSFRRDTVGFTRFGGDLLSHVLRRSTIGAAALNGRVRNGAGCFACAMTTKPRKTHMLHAVCGSGRRKRPAEQVAGRHGSHAGCSISKSSMCRGCMLRLIFEQSCCSWIGSSLSGH